MESLTVNAQLAVPNNLLDLPLLLQIVQRLPRKTAIDLQTIDERRDGDEAVGLHVFVQFVRGGLVEDDGVIGLVLDCRRVQIEFDAGMRGEASGANEVWVPADGSRTFAF